MTTPEKPDALEATDIDTSKESSPIADELQRAAEAKNSEESEEEQLEPAEEGTPFSAKAYKIDVDRALQRNTQDGPGDEDPGPSDWQGYATDEVEKVDE